MGVSVCACVWKKPTRSTPVFIFGKCQPRPLTERVSAPQRPPAHTTPGWGAQKQLGFTLHKGPAGAPPPNRTAHPLPGAVVGPGGDVTHCLQINPSR